MKCVVINGSPHRGNTYELAKTVMRGMREQGDIEFEEIHLGRHVIPFCSGCFCCFERGEDACPHRASIAPVAQAIEAADALIVLTPAYSLTLTALLKNMIDHLSYYFHRPRFFGKKALVLTTTAGAGAKGSAKYLSDVLKHWGFGRVYTYALACRAALGYSPTPKVEKKLRQFAVRFYADIDGESKPKPSLKRVMYYNMWRAMAVVSPESYDGRYWNEKGLAGSAFAPGIRQGPVTRLFGAIVFTLFKSMMKKFS